MSGGSLAREVVTAARILDGLGLVAGFGHVSVLAETGTEVLITPRRAPGLVEENQLVRVELGTGRVLENDGWQPLELPLHLCIYRARPDVRAICRTHSLAASAFGVVGESLLPLHGFGAFLLGPVPIYRDPDLITTEEQGRAVAQTMGQSCGILLRGNGAVVVGKNVRQACVRAVYLEESAQLNLLARHVGRPQGFSEEETARRRRWFEQEEERAWDYLAAKYGSHRGEG
jgi:ribulose-5-phosphate 4-epimerase/fuculose-1-phosphate aldolase